MNRVSLAVVAAALALGVAQPAGVEEAPGKAVYEGTCVACHGPDGKGIVPGVLDLTKKDGPLAKPDAVLIKNITRTLQTAFSRQDRLWPCRPRAGIPT